jgi:hypothetical protein
MKIHNWPRAMFEYQAPAVLNQAAPVQDTWYTVLDTVSNARVYQAGMNVEDTDETLEVKVTLDGITIGTVAIAATHSTAYYLYWVFDPITRTTKISLSTTFQHARSFLLEGHSVKVELRKTSANGAGNLTGIVMYGVLKNV